MLDLDKFYKSFKSNNIENSYIFIGIDEGLIKENIEKIINKTIDSSFRELNLVTLDGAHLEFENFMNACETLPFMSEKKIVLVYRADFLKDKGDKESTKRFDSIHKYMESLPEHCVIIMYYLFEEEREKPSERVKKLDKKSCIVKMDKLKGENLYKKVADIFEERGKSIGKIELKFFCDNIDNNMGIISNEVDKLISYTEGREIKKEDIIAMIPRKSDNDIFNLVDFLSQKRPEKSIDILNELVFRGENLMGIMVMIERQFKLLLNIKLGMDKGKGKDILSKELRLNPYICEKMMLQSKKFTLKQLKKCIELCIRTEGEMKTTGGDKKTKMEMLIVSSVMV